MFSDADAEIMNQGPPQSHMDDIMWEIMKINVRTMGLFYRMSDKVAEQGDHLKDLVDKDIARGEKLLDIERKFGDGCSEGGHICDGNLGLLDEAQIDEEIEMFEEDYPEEVRSLSSVPASAPTEAEPSNVEPPVQTSPSEARETRE
ncbi:hypothetical protein TIFTF001_045666 [Ficus carica]|uniref:Uncharacterized protein n=1 Tax=Ficus carica TaxID=3494 RepID=A0AA88CZC0_FICCA|nr:hypothetical protein TIFTF001_045666 [Ficus carica]